LTREEILERNPESDERKSRSENGIAGMRGRDSNSDEVAQSHRRSLRSQGCSASGRSTCEGPAIFCRPSRCPAKAGAYDLPG
jgi:hypothetical protein